MGAAQTGMQYCLCSPTSHAGKATAEGNVHTWGSGSWAGTGTGGLGEYRAELGGSKCCTARVAFWSKALKHAQGQALWLPAFRLSRCLPDTLLLLVRQCSRVHVLPLLKAASHCHEADEADVSEDAQPKVVAKGLANLDAVPHAAVQDVVGLDCDMAQDGHGLPCNAP